VVTFVVITVTAGMPDLIAQILRSVEELHTWVRTGPFHLSQGQLDQLLDQLASTLSRNRAAIASGAVSTAVTVGELFTEFLLMVFCLIFFLSQGNKIWTFLLGAVPRRVRHRVDLAGRSGFTTLARLRPGHRRRGGRGRRGYWCRSGHPRRAAGGPAEHAGVFFGAFIPVVGSVVAGAPSRYSWPW
jgi:hypothetical protein